MKESNKFTSGEFHSVLRYRFEVLAVHAIYREQKKQHGTVPETPNSLCSTLTHSNYLAQKCKLFTALWNNCGHGLHERGVADFNGDSEDQPTASASCNKKCAHWERSACTAALWALCIQNWPQIWIFNWHSFTTRHSKSCLGIKLLNPDPSISQLCYLFNVNSMLFMSFTLTWNF